MGTIFNKEMQKSVTKKENRNFDSIFANQNDQVLPSSNINMLKNQLQK